MNEAVEKVSEQSVVERALVLRAKMVVDDLYKQRVRCTIEHEKYLSIQTTDATVWDDWGDWDNAR